MAFIEREVGMAAAATAAALSPRVRKVARQGAVYGLAGALKAGDVVVSTARGAVRGAQEGVSGGGGRARRTSTSRSGNAASSSSGRSTGSRSRAKSSSSRS